MVTLDFSKLIGVSALASRVITPGLDNILQTMPVTGDEIRGGKIEVGPNGTLDTVPHLLDEVSGGAITALGGGAPQFTTKHANDVLGPGNVFQPGGSGILYTRPMGTDVLVGGTITPGTDGILQTFPATGDEVITGGTIVPSTSAALVTTPLNTSDDVLLAPLMNGFSPDNVFNELIDGAIISLRFKNAAFDCLSALFYPIAAGSGAGYGVNANPLLSEYGYMFFGNGSTPYELHYDRMCPGSVEHQQFNFGFHKNFPMSVEGQAVRTVPLGGQDMEVNQQARIDFQYAYIGGEYNAPYSPSPFAFEPPAPPSANTPYFKCDTTYRVKLVISDLYQLDNATYYPSISRYDLANPFPLFPSAVIPQACTGDDGLPAKCYTFPLPVDAVLLPDGAIFGHIAANVTLISCPDAIGGYNRFTAKIEAVCNGCTDCADTIASPSAQLFRHCPFACSPGGTPSAPQSTTSFAYNRLSFGYTAQGGSVLAQAGPMIETQHAYACDRLELVTKGKVSPEAGVNLGFRFDYEPGLQPTDAIDFQFFVPEIGAGSYLTYTVSGASPVSVPITASELGDSFGGSTGWGNSVAGVSKTHYVTFSDPGLIAAITAVGGPEVTLELHLVVKVQQLGGVFVAGNYLLSLTGQFTSSPNGGTTQELSCDPFHASLRVLGVTVEPVVTIHPSPPSAGICTRLFQIETVASGGSAGLPEFDGAEFRYYIQWPSALTMTLPPGDHYVPNSAKFTVDGRPGWPIAPGGGLPVTESIVTVGSGATAYEVITFSGYIDDGTHPGPSAGPHPWLLLRRDGFPTNLRLDGMINIDCPATTPGTATLDWDYKTQFYNDAQDGLCVRPAPFDPFTFSYPPQPPTILLTANISPYPITSSSANIKGITYTYDGPAGTEIKYAWVRFRSPGPSLLNVTGIRLNGGSILPPDSGGYFHLGAMGIIGEGDANAAHIEIIGSLGGTCAPDVAFPVEMQYGFSCKGFPNPLLGYPPVPECVYQTAPLEVLPLNSGMTAELFPPAKTTAGNTIEDHPCDSFRYTMRFVSTDWADVLNTQLRITLPTGWSITSATYLTGVDRNANGVPDSVDIALDPALDTTPMDGILDAGAVLDCNGNGILDFVEIALATTPLDVNPLDGIPDDCEGDLTIPVPTGNDYLFTVNPDVYAGARLPGYDEIADAPAFVDLSFVVKGTKCGTDGTLIFAPMGMNLCSSPLPLAPVQHTLDFSGANAVVCAANKTVTCTSGGPKWFFDPPTLNGCQLTINSVSTVYGPSCVITRTWNTDCGTCVQQVTVTGDTTPPVMVCPANQTLTLNAACKGIVPDLTLLAIAIDDCAGFVRVTQNVPAGTALSPGTYAVVITATDGCNSVSCTVTLTVPEAIVLNCPPDVVVDCQDDAGALLSSFPAVTGSSVCCTPSTINVNYSIVLPHQFPIGETPVIATATDGCGNTRTCTFIVVVRGHGVGKWAWARRAGAEGYDSGNAIAVDKRGNVFVTGEFSGTGATFGSVFLTSSGGRDIFVARYDNAGTCIWARRAGSATADDAGTGAAVDDNGNVYVTGKFTGTATFGGVPSLVASTPTDQDIFVAKYNPAGVCLWAVRAGGAGVDAGNGIAIAPNGEVLVTGAWVVLGSQEAFVLKLSSATGATLDSAFSAGPAGHSGSGTSIAVDANNDVYVGGGYAGEAIAFSTGSSSITAPAFTTGFGRMFVVKFTGSTLNAAWLTHSSHGNASCSHTVAGIVVDPTSAAVYVTGVFNGTANFGSVPPLVSGKNGFCTGQLYDYYILKLGTVTGTPAWAVKGHGLDPASNDETHGIAVDFAGNPYVTGFLRPNAPDPYINEGPTVMVAAYSSAGVLRWTRDAVDGGNFAGAPQDVGNGIAVDRAGCVFVAGAFSEDLQFPQTGPAVATLNSIQANTRDVLVARICPTCGCGAPNSCARICGTKFNDLNADGNNQNEPGVQGFTIRATDASGSIMGVAVTDAVGSYCMDVHFPETYSVFEVSQAPWWLQTTVPVVHSVPLNIPAIAAGVNFGNFCESPRGKYGHQRGRKDDFAAPSDSAVPSACLLAKYSSVLWKDFDDSLNNRFVGHTFINLPATIVSASLTVRMRSGGFPGNDTISLGLNQHTLSAGCDLISPPSWSYQATISTLPGYASSGSYIITIPITGALLSKMATDRFLDVLIQDDQTVDWMFLTNITCHPRPRFNGLFDTPVGASHHLTRGRRHAGRLQLRHERR